MSAAHAASHVTRLGAMTREYDAWVLPVGSRHPPPPSSVNLAASAEVVVGTVNTAGGAGKSCGGVRVGMTSVLPVFDWAVAVVANVVGNGGNDVVGAVVGGTVAVGWDDGARDGVDAGTADGITVIGLNTVG